MFKAIVVGTDGSDGGNRAVLAAADLAATQPGSVLHIVSVQKPLSATALAASEMAAAAPIAAEMNWEAEIREELEARLGRAAKSAEQPGCRSRPTPVSAAPPT